MAFKNGRFISGPIDIVRFHPEKVLFAVSTAVTSVGIGSVAGKLGFIPPEVGIIMAASGICFGIPTGLFTLDNFLNK